MSLQLRLALGVAAIVAVGLLAAAITIYATVQAFLFDRVDEQLVQARTSAAFELAHANPDRPYPSPPDDGREGGPQRDGGPGVPAGTFVQQREADGTVLAEATFAFGEDTYAAPALDEGVIDAGATGQRFFTTDAVGSDEHYRVLVESEQEGTTLLVAVPLSDVDSTLGRLRLVLIAVSSGVMLLVAVGGGIAIGLGLRPLHRMGTVASQIAEGNMDMRVGDTDPRTETGRLGLALNAMLERLEQAFRLRVASEERLRRFIADASHELRTPLTSIRGYAELFGRGAKDNPRDLARVMLRIDEQSVRMQVLVEDLLLLAKLDHECPLDMEPVDLATLATDAVMDAKVQQPSRPCTVETEGDCTVFGDYVRLHQVVANLVGNAITHTAQDVPVRVTVSGDKEAVVLTVADKGPGLSPEQAAQVFDPFYRADKGRSRARGGTGLGLAIVAALVRVHSGTVSVDATPGNGAAFTVRLPALSAGAAHAAVGEG